MIGIHCKNGGATADFDIDDLSVTGLVSTDAVPTAVPEPASATFVSAVGIMLCFLVRRRFSCRTRGC